MVKLRILGLGLLALCTIISADEAADLKYISGQTYAGTSTYNSGPEGELIFTFYAPQPGEFDGAGVWQEKRGAESKEGPLTYDITKDSTLIINANSG